MDLMEFGQENVVLFVNKRYVDAVEYFKDEDGEYINRYYSVWGEYANYDVLNMEVISGKLYILIRVESNEQSL